MVGNYVSILNATEPYTLEMVKMINFMLSIIYHKRNLKKKKWCARSWFDGELYLLPPYLDHTGARNQYNLSMDFNKKPNTKKYKY